MIAPQDSSHSSAPQQAMPLSSDLQALLDRLDGNALSVRELEQAIKGRGISVLILLLTIPFCIIPVPGLSIPSGIAILLTGVRIAFGRKLKLPDFILRKRIPHHRLEKLLKAGLRASAQLEKVTKPRMHFIQNGPGMKSLIGVSIASG